MSHRLDCLAVVLVFFIRRLHAKVDRPNIIVIVADDLGRNDVGFNGGDVRTPNLDALAARGVVINRHYTSPCCSPSRTALMTARYPIRTGLHSKPLPAGLPVSLPLKEKIFPQYFRELGYKTHLVGKWHLGYQTKNHLPTRRGFDTFFGFLNGYLSYYDATHTHSGISGRDLRRNEEGVAMQAYGKYLTDLLSEEAVSIIENHPDHGGMLLFLMHSAPHAGNLGYMREMPPNVAGDASHREVFRETVRRLDDSVGDVVAALNNNGILNNTIIVFFSDNGAPTVDFLFHYDNHGSNWPLRGEKLSNREGGVRTPSFIWSPLIRDSARVSQQLFHITDWLPTLYTAAGGNLHAASGSIVIDGVDQWHSLISSKTQPRTELLVDINDVYPSESYILNNWKIVKDVTPDGKTAFANRYFGESGRDAPYDEGEVALSRAGRLLPMPSNAYVRVRQSTALGLRCNDTSAALQEDCSSKYCLYDLAEDPSECHNLAGSYPAVVSMLSARLEDYKKFMVPTPDVRFDPRSDPKYWDDYWSPWMEASSAANPVPWACLVLLCLYAVSYIKGFEDQHIRF